MSLLEKLKVAGKINDRQYARIQANVAQMVKEAKQDPEFLGEALEKTALFGVDWKQTANVLGATALASAGAAVATDLYNTAKDSVQKATRYKGMLDANPDLRKANSKLVQRSFSTLNRFNPSYADDPHVAGSFVRQAIESEGMDLHTLKNLVDANKAIPTQRSAFSIAFDPSQVASSLRFSDPFQQAQQAEQQKDWKRKAEQYSANKAVQQQNQQRAEALHQKKMEQAELSRQREEARLKRNQHINQGFGIS